MMALRKSKPSASTVYDRVRFVSMEANDRYEKIIVKKKPIPERGLRLTSPADAEVQNMIAHRHWESFCDHSAVAVLPLVQEFYANLPESVDDAVCVRGKSVDFSPHAINSFFRVPDIGDDEYSAEASAVTIDDLGRRLCEHPPIEWSNSCFKASAMHVHARLWHAFICARLLPCLHSNKVTRERAVLLHALVNTKSLDVGRLIHRGMKRVPQNSKDGLWFPSLITCLCQQAGVHVTFAMEAVPSKPHIDSSLIWSMKKKEDAREAHPTSFSADDGDLRIPVVASSSAALSSGVPALPSPPCSLPLAERMRRLEERCDELVQYAEASDRKLEVIAKMLGCDMSSWPRTDYAQRVTHFLKPCGSRDKHSRR